MIAEYDPCAPRCDRLEAPGSGECGQDARAAGHLHGGAFWRVEGDILGLHSQAVLRHAPGPHAHAGGIAVQACFLQEWIPFEPPVIVLRQLEERGGFGLDLNRLFKRRHRNPSFLSNQPAWAYSGALGCHAPIPLRKPIALYTPIRSLSIGSPGIANGSPPSMSDWSSCLTRAGCMSASACQRGSMLCSIHSQRSSNTPMLPSREKSPNVSRWPGIGEGIQSET